MVSFEKRWTIHVGLSRLSELGPSRVGCVGYCWGKQPMKSIGYFIEVCVREISWGDLQIGSSDVPIRNSPQVRLSRGVAVSQLPF